MQIGSTFNAQQAMAQVARSVDMLNDMQKKMTDDSLDFTNKMVKVNVTQKVADLTGEHTIDMRA